MTNLSTAEKIQAARSSFCVLVQGADEYYYVIVPADKILAFKNEVATKSVDLAKYAQVVAQGPGTPTPDVVTLMALEYGCNEADAVVV